MAETQVKRFIQLDLKSFTAKTQVLKHSVGLKSLLNIYLNWFIIVEVDSTVSALSEYTPIKLSNYLRTLHYNMLCHPSRSLFAAEHAALLDFYCGLLCRSNSLSYVGQHGALLGLYQGMLCDLTRFLLWHAISPDQVFITTYYAILLRSNCGLLYCSICSSIVTWHVAQSSSYLWNSSAFKSDLFVG